MMITSTTKEKLSQPNILLFFFQEQNQIKNKKLYFPGMNPSFIHILWINWSLVHMQNKK